MSIVVPLSCGPAPALHCLEAIAEQGDDPSFEVVIVDDASVGLAPLLARLDGDVTVVTSARHVGFGAAMRLGAERAHGEVVVALRDGAVPAAGWLSGLSAALADPAVGLAASVVDGDHGAAHEPGQDCELTIVIPTLDAGSERVRGRLAAIAASTDAAHEIVIVDNGSPPQGFSGPVNAGVRAARTPYVVVMNDDVEPQPGWWQPLRATIDAGAAVAFPLTVDGAMRTDFAAWCFAIDRAAIDEFGHAPGELFDPSLVIWFQDTDLLNTLRRAGRPPVLARESTIRHGLSETLGSPDPRLAAWVRKQIELDKRRFEAKHPDVELRPQLLSG